MVSFSAVHSRPFARSVPSLHFNRVHFTHLVVILDQLPVDEYIVDQLNLPYLLSCSTPRG